MVKTECAYADFRNGLNAVCRFIPGIKPGIREVLTMKAVLGVVLFVLYALVTMFGLGPVLFADGSREERMITLSVVIVVYLAITAAAYFIFRKKR
jgi:Family of unknown function (DUF6954)